MVLSELWVYKILYNHLIVIDRFLQQMVFPESAGASVCLVSKGRMLISDRTSGEPSLRMYSFDEPTGEHPSTPVHIATYLLPLPISGLDTGIVLWAPKHGTYSKADQQPFTTAEGASIISADYYTVFKGTYKLYIHPSAFTSFLADQTLVQGTQPVFIPWASWGPKLTRFMLSENYETFFGYNVAYKNNQLSFNTLDIARDLHRARDSTQQDPLSCPHTFFGRDSPTTVPANETFKEDIVTCLPYRRWSAPSEDYLVIPVESWIYFTK